MLFRIFASKLNIIPFTSFSFIQHHLQKPFYTSITLRDGHNIILVDSSYTESDLWCMKAVENIHQIDICQDRSKKLIKSYPKQQHKLLEKLSSLRCQALSYFIDSIDGIKANQWSICIPFPKSKIPNQSQCNNNF